MAELSARQMDFIHRMGEGEQFERRGVDLLLKRGGFETFFDALADAGLFDPVRNPRPISTDMEGYFRIPYWHILDYLKAVAKLSGETSNTELATNVMNVVRAVTQSPVKDGKFGDNYHTAYSFAEILKLVPTSVVSLEDIDLIPIWLEGKFNNSMVGHALAAGGLQRFIESSSHLDWAKACRIVEHATVIHWTEDKWLGGDRKNAKSLVDDYWLKELINKNATALGRVAGQNAAEIFVQRLREVYSQKMEQKASWLTRPAIEDHQQNHSWEGPSNLFVEGLRDVLLGWIDANADACPYVETLLGDGEQIIRRIAIHVIDERFPLFRDHVLRMLTPMLFDFGHIHEVYRFFQSHFQEFSGAEKQATLNALRRLAAPSRDDGPLHLRRIQRQWLSAINGRGSDEADRWFAELEADPTLSKLSPHPDFHSYMESRWGFGDSPFTIQQLLGFVEDGSLVERLNAFVPGNSWDGPSRRSLVDFLSEAVKDNPQNFLPLLNAFERAKREYQYGIISGFKKLWDIDNEQKKIDWDAAWPRILDFIGALITPNSFWEETVVEGEDLSPNRNWIPSLLSNFIREGVRNDERAFSPDLLPNAWGLVLILVEKSLARMEPEASDAMTQAINSPKGHAIEAMIDCALRICRLKKGDTSAHAAEWKKMEPVFDSEIRKCTGANFEFSTLAAAHLPQFHFLSADWADQNVRFIFPLDHPDNCLCALGGLAYSPPTRLVYSKLLEDGVVDWALRQNMKNERARESLLQRIALAYLWNDEELNGPRFSYFFDTKREDDLIEIANYFWSIRGQKLDANQVEKIIAFWEHCEEWSRGQPALSGRLLSALGALGGYLTVIGEREVRLLKASAPYASLDHHSDRFIETLARLGPSYPEPICEVLEILLASFKPSFDLEGNLKGLLIALASHKSTRIAALKYMSDLIDYLPQMLPLYSELSAHS